MIKFLLAFLFSINVFASAIIQDNSITLPKLNAQTSTPWSLDNCTITASVASNALTVALKDKTGANPTAASKCRIAFRSSTDATGTYSLDSVTASLSVVVSSGSTLGQVSATPEIVNVYLIDNAGTAELAVSTTLFRESTRISTTAEGGAGAADARYTMYSTTARSNVGFRVIGSIVTTQTTAGTWAASPTTISSGSFGSQVGTTSSYNTRVVSAQITNGGSPTIARQDGVWISSLTDNGTGDTSVNIATGVFTQAVSCTCNTYTNTGAEICIIDSTSAVSSTLVRVQTITGGATNIDLDFMIICVGQY